MDTWVDRGGHSSGHRSGSTSGHRSGHKSGHKSGHSTTVKDRTLDGPWLSGMVDNREQIDVLVRNSKSLSDDLSKRVVATARRQQIGRSLDPVDRTWSCDSTADWTKP